MGRSSARKLLEGVAQGHRRELEGGAKVGGEVEVEWGFADGKIVGTTGFGVAIGVQDPSPGGAIMLNGGYACTFRTKGPECL
jgi:hypothetical protein